MYVIVVYQYLTMLTLVVSSRPGIGYPRGLESLLVWYTSVDRSNINLSELRYKSLDEAEYLAN